MESRIDLTEGRIAEKLVKLALPIMATSFIQMAYNLTDMLWLEGLEPMLWRPLEQQDFFHN